MFGVDIFNYGHEFFTRLKRKQNLKKMGKRIFGNEDDVVGRTSWFSGTKIKIRQSCLLSEYVGEGNTGAYDGELIIDMKTQSLFLLPWLTSKPIESGAAIANASMIWARSSRATIPKSLSNALASIGMGLGSKAHSAVQ